MSVLLHLVPVSDTMMSVHITEAKYLLLEVCTTTLSPSISHMKSVHIPEAMFLLLKVSSTTSSQSWWHMKSVHITEAKVLLLDVTTTTLNPSFWEHDVITHDWGKVPSANGQYYYIESKFLTPFWQYTWLRTSSYCEWSVLLHWVPVSDTWSKYTFLRPNFYC